MEIIYFKLCNSQIPVIEQALETAALMLGSDNSRGCCPEIICADFLTGANLDILRPRASPQIAILEIKPQGKLHLPRGCGNGDDAKLGGIGNVGRAHVPHRARQVEVHMIEQVVRVGPELNCHVLSNREMLGHPQVQIGVARAAQIVAGTGLQPERAAVGGKSFGLFSE